MNPQISRQSIGIPDSPYLTLEEGARLCRFETCARPVVSFRQFLRRHGVPVKRRGRTILVERRVLEAVMEESR